MRVDFGRCLECLGFFVVGCFFCFLGSFIYYIGDRSYVQLLYNEVYRVFILLFDGYNIDGVRYVRSNYTYFYCYFGNFVMFILYNDYGIYFIFV